MIGAGIVIFGVAFIFAMFAIMGYLVTMEDHILGKMPADRFKEQSGLACAIAFAATILGLLGLVVIFAGVTHL